MHNGDEVRTRVRKTAARTRTMSVRRVPVCLPCGKPGAPGTLYGPVITLKFSPKKPVPLMTGVALNEVAWKDAAGEEVDCTICAYPMSADSVANPWTGPGLFLTQACVNGHVYHKGCLLTHMSRSNNNTATCPECRNPILTEVAASLRRNGAPAPVPAPAPSSGGGLFGGGAAAIADAQGGGNPLGPSMVALSDAAERRAQERRRMENEERRAAQLPYQSLEPLPPMTGVNGHFYLLGGLNDNPTPLEIKEALRYRVQDEPLFADKLSIKMYEQNLDPFHNPPHGMKVTLVQYEFNGLTDEQGDNFLAYYSSGAGERGELGGEFLEEFFDLPSKPMEGLNGAPKWGEDPLGRPPTLNIAPDEYDAWARVERERQEALRREWEEHRAQMAAQRAVRGIPPAGPRTRARAAREAAAEEYEQLDDF